MVTIKNKFAIGCLVQWYEIEMIGEYLQSVKNALDIIENKENVIVDLYFNMTTSLESIDEKQYTMQEINSRFNDIEKDLIEFEILDNLHAGVKDTTPKYVGFFATCKMWDKSWEVLEHPKFTIKPFIDMSTVDTKNWWSLRYNMNIDEMNSFNDKVDDLDIKVLNEYKFNGCGLVISSDVIKSGINIPKSSFFIHEDTAFQFQLQRFFQGQIPQYLIKNILLVHNRKHTKKRSYIMGEDDVELGDVTSGRKKHEWYRKASEMSHHNTYNMFNQSKIYSWEDVL